MSIINSILNMGSAVLMPVIFFIVAILVGVKIGHAFKAALLIGVGFSGLNLVINLLLDNLGPATNKMVERFGVDLTVIDTGWAVSSTIGWGSSIMIAGVIMFMIINLVLFVLNLTKTVDIDIFNYWIFLLVGAVIYAATQNYILSLVIMGVLFILLLKIADWTAPKIQEEFGIKGISFPHMNTAPWVPFGIITNWIIDKIPGINKIELNPKKINEKFGVFGEPIVIGFILGLLIGLLAGFSVPKLLSLSINVAASMVLLPKMVDILMEGLNIVRKAVEEKLKNKFPNREIYIGMDVALISSDPAILATGLLLIPIALLLAVVLPGNKVLPLVDLPSLIFILPMMGAYCKKDMFRMLISGTLMIVCILYFGTDLAAAYTKAAQMSNINLAEGIHQTISLNSGATTPLGWIAVKIGEIINNFF